jgi:hypothetical protein
VFVWTFVWAFDLEVLRHGRERRVEAEAIIFLNLESRVRLGLGPSSWAATSINGCVRSGDSTCCASCSVDATMVGLIRVGLTRAGPASGVKMGVYVAIESCTRALGSGSGDGVVIKRCLRFGAQWWDVESKQ